MLLAHLRPAHDETAATRLVHQLPGLLPVGILEGRAAGLAAQRLRSLPAGGNAVHLGLDRRAFARCPAKPRGDDDRALGQLGMAIRVAERRDRQRHQLARAQHHVAIDEDVLDLAAVSAAVHPHEAADRAGDRAQEFEAGDARVARGRGDEDARGARAAIERRRIGRRYLGEGLAQAHDHARNAAVADDQVGAQPERHDRHLGRQVAQEGLQVGEVLGLEQPIRRAAGLEPDQRGERGVGGELAARGHRPQLLL